MPILPISPLRRESADSAMSALWQRIYTLVGLERTSMVEVRTSEDRRISLCPIPLPDEFSDVNAEACWSGSVILTRRKALLAELLGLTTSLFSAEGTEVGSPVSCDECLFLGTLAFLVNVKVLHREDARLLVAGCCVCGEEEINGLRVDPLLSDVGSDVVGLVALAWHAVLILHAVLCSPLTKDRLPLVPRHSVV